MTAGNEHFVCGGQYLSLHDFTGSRSVSLPAPDCIFIAPEHTFAGARGINQNPVKIGCKSFLKPQGSFIGYHCIFDAEKFNVTQKCTGSFL